jgi:hypothetical protein
MNEENCKSLNVFLACLYFCPLDMGASKQWDLWRFTKLGIISVFDVSMA